MKKEMIVLGIETSCDDTSLAILKGTPEKTNILPELLAFKSFSQEFILQKWGGVVPEIAARCHNEKIRPLLEECLKESKLTLAQIDLIGVTTFPGLIGPLLTGLNSAKTLSLMHNTPIAPINHLHAHLEAIFLSDTISYPYLGLLVSGGNSAFFLVKSSDDFEFLGGTTDDAAGEAFDKGGKMMNLNYPAGRIIDEKASQGDAHKYSFPIALKHTKNSQLSFSGVKTALRVFLEKHPEILQQGHDHQDFYDLCASYQKAIVDALNLKLQFALLQAKQITKLKDLPIVVGGGVACNSFLRQEIQKNFQDVHFVPGKFCTDNGAMVANMALRNQHLAVSFPECLELDAKGKFKRKVPPKTGPK